MRFFFFSSRRRHTRFDCDWSSDVCSSDLFLFARGGCDPQGPDEEGPTIRLFLDQLAGRLAGAVAGLGLDLDRSEEHTSELQSQSNLVCRLLLEKKKKIHDSLQTCRRYCS